MSEKKRQIQKDTASRYKFAGFFTIEHTRNGEIINTHIIPVPAVKGIDMPTTERVIFLDGDNDVQPRDE